MDTGHLNVVDLAAYKAAREQKPLPLFDGPVCPEPRGLPRAERGTPTLSERQVEHRARMLRYLRVRQQTPHCV